MLRCNCARSLSSILHSSCCDEVSGSDTQWISLFLCLAMIFMARSTFNASYTRRRMFWTTSRPAPVSDRSCSRRERASDIGYLVSFANARDVGCRDLCHQLISHLRVRRHVLLLDLPSARVSSDQEAVPRANQMTDDLVYLLHDALAKVPQALRVLVDTRRTSPLHRRTISLLEWHRSRALDAGLVVARRALYHNHNHNNNHNHDVRSFVRSFVRSSSAELSDTKSPPVAPTPHSSRPPSPLLRRTSHRDVPRYLQRERAGERENDRDRMERE